MFKNTKISIKILMVIMIMSLGSLLVIFGASYYIINSMMDQFQQTNIAVGLNSSGVAKESLLSQAEDYLTKLVQKQAEVANGELYEVNKVVCEAAAYTQSLYENSDNFQGKAMPRPDQTEAGVACQKYFLVKGVKETEAIKKEVSILSNCEYMFAPFLESRETLDNIYIGTKSGISYRYSRSNAYNEDYDPRERGWYKAAMESPGQLIWLPTYLDSYGNTCITAAMTFNDKYGRPAGVVASDMMLTSMIEEVMSLKIGETGDCFILVPDYETQESDFVAHVDMDDEGFDADVTHHFSDNDFLDAISKSDEGIAETIYEDKNSYVAYARMSETRWIFCASIETDEVSAPAREAKAQSDSLTEESQSRMKERIFSLNKLVMLYFSIVGIIVILASFAVAGTITRPIQKLALGVRGIGEGHFDQKISVDTGDEVGQLAERFNVMQDDLKKYVEHIREVTAEKERIGAELSVATQIQADMLPSIFPAFPERKEFDIYATMDPAKEVGGDFYDFFFIDHDHLALVMADVSGKGVPAALFMVITKTLIKNHHSGGKEDMSPAAILEKVNDQLCEGNEAGLFVTVWLAIINVKTGVGTAANAGHEHPTICRAGSRFELVQYKHSPAVATMEGMTYMEHDFEIYPGDCIYVYTDGVPEATNKHNELYGTDRMLNALNEQPDADTRTLLQNVKKSVDTFVGDAPQFDDITMLAFKYFG
ncbi:MAG: SpoIIE family protein phosphatase [Lachnospiraceae bacterium]|nr:SpoIIE family protein phosphatase [Lachnospiraceae bacterium]